MDNKYQAYDTLTYVTDIIMLKMTSRFSTEY